MFNLPKMENPFSTAPRAEKDVIRGPTKAKNKISKSATII